jgi:hypothetical protein
VIVDDLDVCRPLRRPDEREPELVVDPNAVLADAITTKALEKDKRPIRRN